MIKAPAQMPDIAETEYIRGKYQERNGATVVRPYAKFNKRGNDVWAERSGRTFFADSLGDDYSGGAKDYSSAPAAPAGSGMGLLSKIGSGKKREGKGTPDDMIIDLMAEGAKENNGSEMTQFPKKAKKSDKKIKKAKKVKEDEEEKKEEKDEGGKKPKRKNARAQIVAKVMREKGMKLIEASKYVKEHGLY